MNRNVTIPVGLRRIVQNGNLTKWERAETAIFALAGIGITEFTSKDLAEVFSLPGPFVSELLQAYQEVQRDDTFRPTFIILRVPDTRTRAAVWSIESPFGGTETLTKMVDQFAKDVACRFTREIEPLARTVVAKDPNAESNHALAMRFLRQGLNLLAGFEGSS